MSNKNIKVVVAGATGRAGRLIVDELVKRDYSVIAMIIKPFDPPEPEGLKGSQIEIREGSLEDQEMIKKVMEGADYLISAIGSTKPFSGKTFEKVDVQGNYNLAIGAKESGIKQFILISSTGAGNSKDAMGCIYKFMMGTVIKAKTKMEEKIKETGIPYTIIRPGGYTEKPVSGKIAISEGGKVSGLVSRQEIATVCVDAIEKKTMENRTFEVVDFEKMKEERRQFIIDI